MLCPEGRRQGPQRNSFCSKYFSLQSALHNRDCNQFPGIMGPEDTEPLDSETRGYGESTAYSSGIYTDDDLTSQAMVSNEFAPISKAKNTNFFKNRLSTHMFSPILIIQNSSNTFGKTTFNDNHINSLKEERRHPDGERLSICSDPYFRSGKLDLGGRKEIYSSNSPRLSQVLKIEAKLARAGINPELAESLKGAAAKEK
ncbi:hypothetical protein MG293_020411 [Ovis ammon polii]|uniref:Uncharacterized protein n=1 Tax=Ovis ammon polii TaxID=230172 RepID=A0AAD4TL17_OVIAM|nr:hypothetical protein MG293_020411 [Ovis ammon polii]